MPVPKVEVGELYEYKELVLHQLGPEVNNDDCLLENGYVLVLCRDGDAISLIAGCPAILVFLFFPSFFARP